jgi:hypothetical protein
MRFLYAFDALLMRFGGDFPTLFRNLRELLLDLVCALPRPLPL